VTQDDQPAHHAEFQRTKAETRNPPLSTTVSADYAALIRPTRFDAPDIAA
jgi:hypothetical protein